jgi:hypothetical protein
MILFESVGVILVGGFFIASFLTAVHQTIKYIVSNKLDKDE